MINSAEQTILQIALTFCQRTLIRELSEISTEPIVEKVHLQMPCITAQKLMLKVRTFCYYATGRFETFCKCKKTYLKFLINIRVNGTFLVHFHGHLASIQFNIQHKDKHRSLLNKIRLAINTNILSCLIQST